jgi:hypothetical protein
VLVMIAAEKILTDKRMLEVTRDDSSPGRPDR